MHISLSVYPQDFKEISLWQDYFLCPAGFWRSKTMWYKYMLAFMDEYIMFQWLFAMFQTSPLKEEPIYNISRQIFILYSFFTDN